MGAWHVRPAAPGDGAGLAALHLDTSRTYVALDETRFRMPDEQGLATWMDEDLETAGAAWICFVAVEDDRIVGQIEARLIAPMDTARYQSVKALGVTRGFINSLGVLASHRRRGIGRELVANAERWLADRGAVVVELDTLAASPESVPFYESLGYEPNKLIFERQL